MPSAMKGSGWLLPICCPTTRRGAGRAEGRVNRPGLTCENVVGATGLEPVTSSVSANAVRFTRPSPTLRNLASPQLSRAAASCGVVSRAVPCWAIAGGLLANWRGRRGATCPRFARVFVRIVPLHQPSRGTVPSCTATAPPALSRICFAASRRAAGRPTSLTRCGFLGRPAPSRKFRPRQPPLAGWRQRRRA